ncbi:MAG TPA: PAS domain-containing protein [Methylovirgula sp.]|jgi:PAS domain-containing protein
MPRFYFHLRFPDGYQRDEIGFDCAHAEAAYLEAYRTIPRMAADLLEKGSDPMRAVFEISDEQGAALFQIPFTERVRPPRPVTAAPTNFRSARANLMLAESIFHRAFASSIEPYLVLSPDLRMTGANAAYLRVMQKRHDELTGFYVFDAFPDNPEDSTSTCVNGASASFLRVLTTGQPDVAPLRRYDIKQRDGTWAVRHWHTSNWAIFDDSGSIIAVVHRAVEAASMTG